MPGAHRTIPTDRRVPTAALAFATVATFVIMVWAVLPGVAFVADPPGTTITPHSSSTRTTTSVLPTTVTPPGGTAFTGAEGVVPLGAIALFLMSVGSGLLWMSGRRRRGDEEDES